MKINISLSTTSILKDERARSLIRCLYVILLLKTDSLTSERAKILRENSMPAKEFLKDHKLGAVVFGKLFDAALLKKDLNAIKPQLEAVYTFMREKSKSFSSNAALTNLYTSIIRDFRSYVQSGNENAYLRLEKNAKETGEYAIFSRFVPDEQDFSIQIRALRRIVRKYEPDNLGLFLSIDVAKELREQEPDVYKGYLRVRNDLNKAYGKELIAFFRQQGKPLIDVRLVKDHFEKMNMPHTVQKGFVGQMDESGNFYTVKGKTNPGRQLKTKPGGQCYMNPMYDTDKDNTYVLKSKTPGAENETMFYTKDFGATSQVSKYSKVEENIPKFEAARAKWIKDIMGSNREKFMLGLLCEMSYLSTARIGSRNENISNKGDHKGEHTFGIRTLLCKHAKIDTSKITISYLGVKTSARLKHFVYKDTPEGKRIFDYIEKRKASAGPNDPLFVVMGKMVSPTKLNEYVRSKGLTITIHKFRTIRGTEFFLRELEKNTVLNAKTTKNPERVLKEMDKVLEVVGKALGHFTSTEDGTKFTGNTALQYYIVPSVPLSILERLNIRLPPKYKKLQDEMIKGGADKDDD